MKADGPGLLRFGDVRIPFTIARQGIQGRPFDVVGLGENSVDLMAVVAEYPVSNTKQRLQRFARQSGGQIATALVACAKLGWKARYIGRFGEDEFGACSRDSLTAAGVDVSAARTVAGATNQFAVILVDARTGARTVLWDRHPGLTAAAQAARYARQAHIPTVIDVEKVRPGILEVLQQIDAIIAAEDFPTALTGHEDLGRALEAMARESNAPLVCVTLGAKGSLARCGGREIRTPAFAVDCLDSTGAGDVFRGAFVAGCLRAPDGDIEDVLAYANAAAALNCRGLGGRGALPSPEEVERLLQTGTHM